MEREERYLWRMSIGIVEYVSGIQTFRAYGVGGLKNKTVIHAMQGV